MDTSGAEQRGESYSSEDTPVVTTDSQEKQMNTDTETLYKVIRRNGTVTPFAINKISIALTKAFLNVEGRSASGSSRIHDTVRQLTDQIKASLFRRMPDGGIVHIENIQDQVELALMRSGERKVARSYVLYREQRAKIREQKASEKATPKKKNILHVKTTTGELIPLNEDRLHLLIKESVKGLEGVDEKRILQAAMHNLFDGIAEVDISTVLVMSTRVMIERDPNYSNVAARLLLDGLRREAISFINTRPSEATQAEMVSLYPELLPKYIKRAIELELLDEELGRYDLKKLGGAIKAEQDHRFTYLGLQTLYDRYFIHTQDGIRFELPQSFFMRVAMGLAINEIDRETRAIEFYELLSSFIFMSSPPTLFNSGSLRPQLSSCYLTTVPDDLAGIYDATKDNALLSKFAGGLGNDWTPVRGLGSHIKGTNGKSQGVVPFLKVVNDTAVAVNQCFAPDTLVYTAHGTKKIKHIENTDLVLGQRGEYRQVKQKMLYNQTDPMVEIKVKHSISTLKVTSGHPLWALQSVPMEQATVRTKNWLEKNKIKPQWVEAGELKKGDYVAQVIPKEILPVTNFTVDDARLYGILLSDGHSSKKGLEWGVSGNPDKDTHLDFVKNYLEEHGIHYWIKDQRKKYLQIGWASDFVLARDATTGQYIRGDQAGFIFDYNELYDAKGKKHIHPRFNHLPKAQTLALIQGLIETDGHVSRGTEITFTNTSQPLIEGLRYQLLRLGVPSAGQYREPEHPHTGQRADGDEIYFNNATKSYDLRIPAIEAIAKPLGCKVLTKKDWLEWNGCLFSRLRSIEPMTPSPFVYDLKVEGDATYMTTHCLASNGGKRKGAICAYLETWHIDIEEFLELRKNTGDERRRTHDMNSANWIPDYFMKRVANQQDWTLFSPDETPDLHDLYGKAFEKRYLEYEAKAAQGEIRLTRTVKAVELWKKMLGMLFETGHPWLVFKDPCNIRYTNQHVGVVHSSNLCTEITLHTNADECAVCNLGSVNLAAHTTEDGINMPLLEKTIKTATRMLDNVIEYNYYSIPQARRSNLQHRPVGLGIMGFQDALYKLNIAYASEEAVEFADRSMEAVSYFAIQGSNNLAKERGAYSTYQGSLWSQGILPIDSLELMEKERGEFYEVDKSSTLDWDSLRESIQQHGMRNSNVMAIAPTATISNICGVSQSIEPTYQNLFVKSNLSGEFTVVNPYMVNELKQLGLWDEVMINDMKYFDGSVQPIERIPEEIKAKYATAFEIDPRWLVEAASRRQKWIDQGQSLNLYMSEPSGSKLDNLYKLAWVKGLKTTYYLRSMGATHMEKTSDDRIDVGTNADTSISSTAKAPAACSILDPECEACQ
jgi:ribonucleoside-diphosphate reductase alpha chain